MRPPFWESFTWCTSPGAWEPPVCAQMDVAAFFLVLGPGLGLRVERAGRDGHAGMAGWLWATVVAGGPANSTLLQTGWPGPPPRAVECRRCATHRARGSASACRLGPQSQRPRAAHVTRCGCLQPSASGVAAAVGPPRWRLWRLRGFGLQHLQGLGGGREGGVPELATHLAAKLKTRGRKRGGGRLEARPRHSPFWRPAGTGRAGWGTPAAPLYTSTCIQPATGRAALLGGLHTPPCRFLCTLVSPIHGPCIHAAWGHVPGSPPPPHPALPILLVLRLVCCAGPDPPWRPLPPTHLPPWSRSLSYRCWATTTAAARTLSAAEGQAAAAAAPAVTVVAVAPSAPSAAGPLSFLPATGNGCFRATSRVRVCMVWSRWRTHTSLCVLHQIVADPLST